MKVSFDKVLFHMRNNSMSIEAFAEKSSNMLLAVELFDLEMTYGKINFDVELSIHVRYVLPAFSNRNDSIKNKNSQEYVILTPFVFVSQFSSKAMCDSNGDISSPVDIRQSPQRFLHNDELIDELASKTSSCGHCCDQPWDVSSPPVSVTAGGVRYLAVRVQQPATPGHESTGGNYSCYRTFGASVGMPRGDLAHLPLVGGGTALAVTCTTSVLLLVFAKFMI